MAETDSALASELVGESALSLGRAGAKLQRALDALAAHDAAGGDTATRRDLVDDAGEQAWHYVVLRGALGWHDDALALDAYQVPAEVRARMGVRRKAGTSAAPAAAPVDHSLGPPYR
jgi:hypothetical protein